MLLKQHLVDTGTLTKRTLLLFSLLFFHKTLMGPSWILTKNPYWFFPALCHKGLADIESIRFDTYRQLPIVSVFFSCEVSPIVSDLFVSIVLIINIWQDLTCYTTLTKDVILCWAILHHAWLILSVCIVLSWIQRHKSWNHIINIWDRTSLLVRKCRTTIFYSHDDMSEWRSIWFLHVSITVLLSP